MFATNFTTCRWLPSGDSNTISRRNKPLSYLLDDRGSDLERVGIEPTAQCLQNTVAWPWYMPSHGTPGRNRTAARPDS